MMRCAVLLMGPTGAGKSDLAVQLVEKLPLEIISVDSALVYRGMDIGTAKPDRAIRVRIPHHLIDIRDPVMSYSVGEFLQDAATAMENIWARGRQPLLVGGTMLYFHALTAGIAELPAADLVVRRTIDAQASRQGWPALHRQLAQVDPVAATRIHANDAQRIQRALEVFHVTGQTITGLQQTRTSVLAGVEVIEFVVSPLQRTELQTRLGQRFMKMMAAGFLGEIRALFERGDLTAEHPAMRAVGYRQLWQHLMGQYALDEAVERAIVATRQLAKRQLTWLRRRQSAQWVDSMHPQVARAILGVLSEGKFAEWSQV